VIPTSVVALAEGVLKVMLVSKLKIVTAVLLAVAVASGGLMSFLPAAAGQQPAVPAAAAASYPAAPAAGQGGGLRQTKTLKVKPGMVVGVVSEVDAKANRISVRVPTTVRAVGVETKAAKSIGLENLPVRKGAPLTVNGKEGKLGDIAAGDQVVMGLEVANGVIEVTRIDVSRK
jgi:hypothetical protein